MTICKRLCAVILSAICCVSLLHAAPKSDLWDYWQKSGDKTAIDHSAWQAFLDTYLISQSSGPHLLRYAHVTKKDAQSLKNYINYLSTIDIRHYTKNQQFAYWANLYNAATVDLIVDNYPVSSITKIKSSFFSFGPWDKKILTIAQKKVSLNDIEHRILRPIWRDKRIHYIVNCASFSCPSLPLQAVPTTNLDAFLDQAATEYIADARAVEIVGNSLKLSSIYDWYASDFGSPQALVEHLVQHRPTLDRAQLTKLINDADYHYQWHLNEAQ